VLVKGSLFLLPILLLIYQFFKCIPLTVIGLKLPNLFVMFPASYIYPLNVKRTDSRKAVLHYVYIMIYLSPYSI